MADPKVRVQWKQPAHTELGDGYSRFHTLNFPGGIRVAATDCFVDDPPLVDREVTADAAFAAALASSYAMTFLHIAAQHRIDVAEFEVEALVELGERNDRLIGDPEIKEVILRPSETYRGAPPAPGFALALHRETQRRCPIANAVKCKVTVRLLCEALANDGLD